MLELKILPYPLDGFTITEPDDKSGFLPDRPEGTPYPVSSINGKIKTLLFIIPKDGRGPLKYDYLNLFYELVQKMDTVEAFIVFHYEDEFYNPKRKKAKVIAKSANRVHPIRLNDNSLSVWAQDLFYPVHYHDTITNKKSICLLTGNDDHASYKPLINKIIENRIIKNNTYTNPLSHSLICKETELPFDGGNILVGDTFLLVGKNHKHRTEDNTYEKWFGEDKKVIFIEHTHLLPRLKKFPTKDGFINILPNEEIYSIQPLIHIDLFITLAGYNTDNQYTIVIGEPTLDGHFPNTMSVKEKEILHTWIEDMKRVVNSSIVQLKKDFPHPLHIVRTPLVLTYSDYVVVGEPLTRKWFWVSYNNCLVEVYENEGTGQLSKKVWLPSYGSSKADYSRYVMPYNSRQEKAILAEVPINNVKYGNWRHLSKFDKINKRIWKNLGFKTTLLKNNYLPIMSDRGALNCITNCIERN